MEAIWNKVKESIMEKMPSHSFNMWIEPLAFDTCTNNDFVVLCPNLFSKKKIQSNYGSMIESEIKKTMNTDCRLVVQISDNCNKLKKQKPSSSNNPNNIFSKQKTNRQQDLPCVNNRPYGGRLLKKDFTFDNFIVGGNNDFAYSAALSMTTRNNTGQNSLFILSKTGMGKTHLTQAMGHHFLSRYPSDRVFYMTAEDFTGEMIRSFRNNTVEKFKNKYRTQCDVLILEDIHFLTGKERTQLELCFALDYMLEANKKIVLSSCYLPADIPKMSDQLKSRLTSGLISTIEPPGFKTRVRILKNKSRKNGINLPDAITDYLADELSENVRQLESGLIGVTAKSSLLGVPIDLALAESVVKNIGIQNKIITIDIIKKLVCKEFNISVNDIVSPSRKKCFVQPRQLAIFLSRRYTDQPLQSIGKSFNRQHATAIHAIGAVEKGLKVNNSIQKQIHYLCKKLESGKL